MDKKPEEQFVTEFSRLMAEPSSRLERQKFLAAIDEAEEKITAELAALRKLSDV